MPEKFEGTTPPQESKKEVLKNQGQKIAIPVIKGESHWVGTVYDDGGFDYHIQPINLEVRNQEEIDRRTEAGEDRNKVLDELADEYIQRNTAELGIDPEGYVSADGRVYESGSDPKIEELEAEK